MNNLTTAKSSVKNQLAIVKRKHTWIMVTAEVGLDGVAKAFADLANPEAHTKIIVQPWR